MNTYFQKVSDCPQYPMNNESWMRTKFDEINKGELSYTLVNVNLKNFSYFNLKHGWEVGNEILFLVYQAMLKELDDNEFIAYVSADSYVLLLQIYSLNLTNEEMIALTYSKIGKIIDAIFEIGKEILYKNLYASIGLCHINLGDSEYYTTNAIANLFRKIEPSIKQRSFSVNFYLENELQRLQHMNDLKQSTANALANGEYQVYIQPKIDLKTRKIVGGEALLRRFDKNGVAIPLSEFLPILNTEGYIRMVDWWVFESVCEKIKAQIKENKPMVPISFNISKEFFYDDFIYDNYINTYKEFDIPQKYIEFELMETISLDDTGRMIEVIKRFENAGFKCSLDDFGNGYSSFGVLLNANFTYVKLDRIFFINPLNENCKKILNGVVSVLKSLGFKLVAEGVETKEYVDYLTEIGCDIIQGYYFYQPMPLAEFMELLYKENV